MKSLYAVVLLASLLALAHAFPGANRESAESTEVDDKNDGVVLLIPSRHNIFDDMDDDDEPMMGGPGMWHPFRFEHNPFDGLFSRMQETMNRIRAEMAAALASQLGGQGGLTPWGKIPEGANTTSTTKVIGDHQVTINETTYSDGDENSGTIFRVRVVDVKPLNETSDAVESDSSEITSEQPTPRPVEPTTAAKQEDDDREELTTPNSRSVETVEEFDNEIPKSQVDTLTA